MPNPFRRREYETSVQHTHPHFQKLMRWDSKFDWFCLAIVLLLPILFFKTVASFF